MTKRKSQTITVRSERIQTIDVLVYSAGLENRPDVPLKRRHFIHALIDLYEDGTIPKELLTEKALQAADNEYIDARPDLKAKVKR